MKNPPLVELSKEESAKELEHANKLVSLAIGRAEWTGKSEDWFKVMECEQRVSELANTQLTRVIALRGIESAKARAVELRAKEKENELFYREGFGNRKEDCSKTKG